MLNIDQIRVNTIGCHDKLFFNSAGSSLPPVSVHEKVKEHLNLEEQIGGYKAKTVQQEQVDQFYTSTANLINCHPHNIAFCSNASEAFAKALSSIPFKNGDVIITTDDDYTSNYINFISIKRRINIDIVTIRNLDNGDLDIDHFNNLIKKQKPALVSITHIPTNSGLIQDVQAIGEICETEEITYLVDACQSIGQMNVDVQEIKCDFLSTTGRKFLRGPRGTGFLYVSDRMLAQNIEPLYIELGGAELKDHHTYEPFADARKYEMWEKPYALLLGLNEAIAYAQGIGLNQIENHNKLLCTKLRAGLESIPHLQLYDRGSKIGSLVTFHLDGSTIDQVSQHLDQCNIYHSRSTFDAAPMDFTKKGIEWAIRLSPHYFNTLEEVDDVVSAIGSMSLK